MFGKVELFIIFHTNLKAHCISFLTASRAPIFKKKKKKNKLHLNYFIWWAVIYNFIATSVSGIPFGKNVCICYVL